jgi:hypothetical protein
MATQLAAVVGPVALTVVFHRWILSVLIFGVIDLLYVLIYLPVATVLLGGKEGSPLSSEWDRDAILSNIDDPAKLVVIAAVIMAARMAWRLGTRLHRRRRDEIVLKEKPPVLLLRSFADDAAKIPPSALLPRLFFRRKRLEEMIGEELTRIGPFVAIGKPGERLPQLGAQRLYVADDEWQDVVRAYIGRAGRIIMIAGTTHWVRWELASTIEQGSLDKLLVVFPRLTDAERAARWENLKPAFQATRWEQSAAQVTVARALALLVGEDGRFAIITSRRGHESDYEAALRIAAYLMRPSTQPAPALSTGRAAARSGTAA